MLHVRHPARRADASGIIWRSLAASRQGGALSAPAPESREPPVLPAPPQGSGGLRGGAGGAKSTAWEERELWRHLDVSASMSACMRSLYSSDQWAPGFRLALLCGFGRGGVLLSLADFRAATLSLSVTRDGVELEDEFELLMQLFRTYFNWLSCWW